MSTGNNDKLPQFVISAHVVRQLGEQLVSDEVTALIELVKNAYDADAARVNIVVNTNSFYQEHALGQNSSVNPGYITVIDNGTGMDENDVERGWLRISFSFKRKENEMRITTPRYKRTFLGSKGVGRLSSQRLGNRIDLFSLKSVPNGSSPEDEKNWVTVPPGVHVGVNWGDFGENVDLQDVPVEVESWVPRNGRGGTRLVVTELRNPEVWRVEASRSVLVNTLAQLISPFDSAKSFRIGVQIDDKAYDLLELTRGIREGAVSSHSFEFDGKQLRISGKVKASVFKGGNDKQNVIDYQTLVAPDLGAELLEYLRKDKSLEGLKAGPENWMFSYEVCIDVRSLNLLERIKPTEDPSIDTEEMEVITPGPFRGEIDQLAYDTEETGDITASFGKQSEYREYVKRQAGVRIYRDGFGIRPYGLGDNDWMGFRAGATSGGSFYGLRPNNLIGYVALTARDNESLEEKTDREGFVQNAASQNFFKLTAKARDQINLILERVRRRYNDYRKVYALEKAQISDPKEGFATMRNTSKQTASLKEKVSKLNVSSVETSVSKTLDQMRKQPLLAPGGNDPKLQTLLSEAQQELLKVKDIITIIKQVEESLEQLAPTASYLERQLQQLNEQVTDFSELAGVGLTAEALTHEIGNVTDRLLLEAKNTSESLASGKIDMPKIARFIERVHSSLHALHKQIEHLEPSMRHLREKRDVISLTAYTKLLSSYYESRVRFQEFGIEIEVINNKEDLFSIRCSQGKLTQVFDNLILNSEYWLAEAVRKRRVRKPKITIQLHSPFVEISDNGFGIDPGIVPQIFQPFVTTKPKEEGRGLGLFISSQLMDTMNCSIALLPDLNQFQRPFIFRLDFTGALYEQQ
jgi:signal transduction histidine kinase